MKKISITFEWNEDDAKFFFEIIEMLSESCDEEKENLKEKCKFIRDNEEKLKEQTGIGFVDALAMAAQQMGRKFLADAPRVESQIDKRKQQLEDYAKTIRQNFLKEGIEL